MGKAIPSLLIIFLFCVEPDCNAQKEPRIGNTRIELKNNQIHITYDIFSGQLSDQYNVRVEVSDSTGNIVDAKSLIGDIGKNVSSGSNKLIIWSLEEDGIYLNADIFIQIYAIGVQQCVPYSISDQLVNTSSYNRNGIVLQSLVFPGLGLSRMTGNPHWLRGVAGYSCIAGSIVFNRMAISSYEDYKTSGSAENASSLLAETNKYENTSEVLAYAAIAIWVTDIIWTIVGSSELKKNPGQRNKKGISLGTGFDTMSNVPLLAIRYEFSVK